ncbi:Golgi apparatus membrane protein TVP38 [Irpex rosettiformis]|uniref:Golgi apparatus membrane protein TVP38 n=1 Tax=Irpex rosettiformis TaxID=378272 RepID=A0ACB8UE14_9APHY|nr:Golgi apparatus membrane protein TVP38 [Irpex rosettiformis]
MSADEERQSSGAAWLWRFVRNLPRNAWHKYKALGVRGKLIVWCLVFFYIALGVFFAVVGADRIAQTMYNVAQRISHLQFGWMILVVAMIIISFPPFTGFTTTVTLCGFAYGMKGFFVASAGTLVGSAVAFSVLRWLFSARLRKWVATNEKWQALESVVRAKGLFLMVLIRASPFPPWAYSNSLFSSISPVALWQFVIATLVVLPRVALHVFIGSRLAAFSDGETRSHMDKQTKILNALVIVLGIVVGILASWLTYRSMQSHIRHLSGISPEVDELAAEAVEDASEGAPLLSQLSSESLDEEGSISTIRPSRPSTSP